MANAPALNPSFLTDNDIHETVQDCKLALRFVSHAINNAGCSTGAGLDGCDLIGASIILDRVTDALDIAADQHDAEDTARSLRAVNNG